MDDTLGLKFLKLKTPLQLTQQELEGLKKALDCDPTERTFDYVLRDILSGTSFVLGWETGAVVVMVIDRGTCRELFLDILGGMGYVKNWEAITHDLKTLAKKLNCKILGAMSPNEKLVSFQERNGWKRVGVYGILEVE